MKPFDLDLAKAGHPVCTRDGSDVRMLCFDRKGSYPLCGIVDDDTDNELECWTSRGLFNQDSKEKSCYDLFLKEGENEEKTYFVLCTTHGDTLFFGKPCDSIQELMVSKESLRLTFEHYRYRDIKIAAAEITIKKIIEIED